MNSAGIGVTAVGGQTKVGSATGRKLQCKQIAQRIANFLYGQMSRGTGIVPATTRHAQNVGLPRRLQINYPGVLLTSPLPPSCAYIWPGSYPSFNRMYCATLLTVNSSGSTVRSTGLSVYNSNSQFA